MKTLLLDTESWDLVLDIAGNIAVASEPYSQAQDVASACRLFAKELWYNTSLGLPYFAQILGKAPPLSLIKQSYVSAAKRVPGVLSAKCFVSLFSGRQLVGQVQIKTSNGTFVVPFQQV